MSEHHPVPTQGSAAFPVEAAIECEAVPLERPRVTAGQAGTWVLTGFLLVAFLKIVGLLIVVLWMIRRFPRAAFAVAAAIPVWHYAKRRRMGNQSPDKLA